MCLIVKLSKTDRLLLKLNIKRNLKPKRARKDINVYKVLSFYTLTGKTTYYTPFRAYQIVFSENRCELPKCKMTIEQDSGNYSVTTGYHTFTDSLRALRIESRLDNGRVFDAIIPKGTKYFIGRYNDIVSEKLIIYRY